MLKLKMIDLLIKIIKSTRTDVVTTYKSIRNLRACVEKRGELEWVVGCSLGGERWVGKKMRKKNEKQRKRVSVEWVYTRFYQWNHRQTCSVGDSIGDSVGGSATSLYDYPGLNLSVKSSEKNPRHHTVATFQKNYIIRR